MSNNALAVRVNNLRQGLEKLASAKAAAGEAGELSQLKDDLDEKVRRLRGVLAVRAALATAGVNVALPASCAGVKKRATALRERFEKEPRADVLKKGQTWRTWKEHADNAANDITLSVRAAWQGYQASVFSGETPAAVEKLLAPTQTNKGALGRYKRAYEEFRGLFKELPQSAENIAAVRAKADELIAIAAAFDFAVPAEVKAFLEAVQSGGAPLSSLTEAVIEWLHQSKTYDHYRISALRAP